VPDQPLSPDLSSIAQLAREENIAEQTLYNWRNRAKQQGKTVPTNHRTQELSPETKLTIIIDTAKLNETELAEYCRNKGLYPEQIAQCKAQSLTGFNASEQQTAQSRKQHQADQKQIKQLKHLCPEPSHAGAAESEGTASEPTPLLRP
ncbi:helix-turn-helix domain-containing protein, partial [Mycobacterium tuberculosis]|nr:helix-turn-helix domain-containing protein [Mycobacterium tuberculosis]